MSEDQLERLSRRDALLAAIVGLAFGTVLAFGLVYISRDRAPLKPAPLVLPPEDRP